MAVLRINQSILSDILNGNGVCMQKMDPQLRKLLEVSYEALIHSGLIIGDLPSERCGVYIGCCGSEVN